MSSKIQKTALNITLKSASQLAKMAIRCTLESMYSPGLTEMYVLKLYIVANSLSSELALRNIRRICDKELQNQYALEVIDVLKHPQVAEEERIFATPTLVKESPAPFRRIIGDLSDTRQVLNGLGIISNNERHTED